MTKTVESNGRRWRLSFAHRDRGGKILRRDIRTRTGAVVNARIVKAYLLVADLDGSNEHPVCQPGISYCKPPDAFVKEEGRRLALKHLMRKAREAGAPMDAVVALKRAYDRRPVGVPTTPRPTPQPARQPQPVRWGLAARAWDLFFGQGMSRAA